MKKRAVLFVFVLMLARPVVAQPAFVLRHVPQAAPVGTYQFSFLFWDIYNITLYAPNGTYQAGKPYALKLDYLRTLYGNKIAERSTDEIKGQGYSNVDKIARWHIRMAAIFPDVNEGDNITAIADNNGYSLFYLNGEFIGKIEDAEFTDRFFAIWLDEKTSEPEMRRNLLGRE